MSCVELDLILQTTVLDRRASKFFLPIVEEGADFYHSPERNDVEVQCIYQESFSVTTRGSLNLVFTEAVLYLFCADDI